jgi:hypothetical protein
VGEGQRHPDPLLRKGENKQQLARPLLEAAARQGGQGRVVLVGIAQERASVWRSWPAKGHEHRSHPHMEWGRQMAFVNHFYFYLWDPEWGGAFWKTNAYAPYPVWLWLNGHEWAKRQLEKAGIGHQALDNGFAACDDPAALQRICDRLGPGALTQFLWRWQQRLPSLFTRADLKAGYTYELAVRQFEVADTRVFDRPPAGRAFFEGLIRDHLDIGRPAQVALIFDRTITRRTPGTFRTKVITKGVDPQLVCYYKASPIKQYFKQHRALRTETVIGDTRDFGIGRRRGRASRAPAPRRRPGQPRDRHVDQEHRAQPVVVQEPLAGRPGRPRCRGRPSRPRRRSPWSAHAPGRAADGAAGCQPRPASRSGGRRPSASC